MAKLNQNEMEITMINLLNNLEDNVIVKLYEQNKLESFCYSLSLDMHTTTPYNIHLDIN